MKETIEEKRAINNMKKFAGSAENMTVVTAKDMNIVLELVEKLQKENEKLKAKMKNYKKQLKYIRSKSKLK